MLRPMKPLALILAVSATLALAACGDERPAPSRDELRAANQDAANQAEKTYDKENPANPSALK